MRPPENLAELIGQIDSPNALVDSLFSESPLGMQVYSSDGRSLYVNNAFVQMFGAAPTSDYCALHDKVHIKNGTLPLIEKAFSGESVRLPITWTAEKKIAVETRTFALFNSQREVTHVIFIFQDVTAQQLESQERLKFSKQLNDANNLIRDLLNGTDALIFIKDLDGALLLVNRQFEHIFNVKSADVLGKRDHEIFPKMVADEYRRNDINVLITGESKECEETVYHLDGSRHTYISLKFPLADSEGKVFGICGISTDITQFRKMEQELSAARQMESLGVLAGGLAHDFNNILGVILMHAEVLPGADEIKKSAQRASDLTRQLLAFGRKQVLAPITVNINEVVLGMGTMLKSMLGADISLELNLEPNVDLIHADPTQLEQVLMNLCRNAGDAMHGGGKLILTTRNVALIGSSDGRRLCAPAGDYVELVVQDTGHGISPDIRDRIFEPFFSTKDKDKGTGLGLSSVYGILQQSNGDIAIESEPGKGAQVRVFFPKKVAASMPAPQARTDHQMRGTETVLLIEDEPALRTITAGILRGRGYTVHVAENVAQAEKILRENVRQIDLIISDVIMPEENGPALIARLAEEIPMENLKVLFVSGHSYNKIEASGLSLDSMYFLEKPYGVSALVRKIQQILNPPRPSWTLEY